MGVVVLEVSLDYDLTSWLMWFVAFVVGCHFPACFGR